MAAETLSQPRLSSPWDTPVPNETHIVARPAGVCDNRDRMAEIALRQIRAIIAVCEEGSFTRAAARENATQSGISQHVAAAERTLGVKLFERSAAGVTPTPAGQRYYRRCIEAVGQLANAAEEVRGFAARVSGDLRIGLIPTLTRALAVELAARNPAVRVNCILPGPVMLPPDLPQAERDESIAGTLVKREGTPAHIVQAVLFLIDNDFVTGVCLPVDGGRTIA